MPFVVGRSGACGLRASPNGMGVTTLFPWRPALVPGVLPWMVSDLGTERAMNPRCGATRPLRRERCARSSLPCVASTDRRTQPNPLGRGIGRSLRETGAAKEAKRRFDCGGNRLGCPHRGRVGITVRTKWQSGTARRQRRGTALKGEPPDRQREAGRGESQPDQSRRITPFRCRCLASKKRTQSSFLRRFRCASRAPKAHGRSAQRVISDAHVVENDDSIHFAPAGAKI